MLWKVTNGASFVYFHVCDTMYLGSFPSVSTHCGYVHDFVFKLAFVESGRGAKPLGNSSKAVRTQATFCCDGTKRKKSKLGRFPRGPQAAFSPALVTETIFLTSKLPPLIISLTFQLESSRQGTPNSGADFLPVSGQPWHACL